VKVFFFLCVAGPSAQTVNMRKPDFFDKLASHPTGTSPHCHP